ncbi:hypothetical protein [Pseudoalteromonas luteoviolacea]|uniref:Uncharacterized protein n=1 Tax=Pseudoalteromonas luteoviolacea S4054 TaxID=1129367 RepID=A0A0F6ACE6_9GAMM|nr:hypothetical protein [Pseudoalteromonas luteoviolacea]AOT09626.1 hypothetical protein S4054249_18160 [Pseudoalteromonas luteoviolacea]AOT14538.1 hypothetical protein S40542_18130 [Pseudoalteromonas luteoviolacea]AOT19453.1 hypothetical protein S4054_18135 [Pseudoalteromonas luteoviolacea]KKE83887.1 hypothetical protein N479_10780 [Pseudoalteromonas luteoviolacea S4054]KZN77281.1 hypothetical protein N481_04320 [Pseudoalteromonas luteoviolacea S4047-1]
MNSLNEQIIKVEQRIRKQTLLKASLGSVIGSVIVIAIWFQVYMINSKLSPLMIPISGAIIGLFVRFFGQGYDKWFSAIACMVFAAISSMAWYMEIVVGGKVTYGILAGLFYAGFWSANYLAKLKMPIVLEDAFTHLQSSKKYPVKGTTFKAVMSVLGATIFSLGATYGTAIVMIELQYQFQSKQKAQMLNIEEQKKQKKEIAVTIEALSKYSTSEALLYAHAYFSGYKFNQSGKYTRGFPRSVHKSQMILEYLMKERQDHRAQFILGVILQGNRGERFIDMAAEQGDHYAALYQAFYAGCKKDTAKGDRILDAIYPLVKESAIKSEIESVRSYGYEPVCNEISQAHFPHSFIRGYITLAKK